MEMNRKEKQCHNAMARAYKSLREKNLPDDWAADAGATIYQFHYPKASKDLAIERANSLLRAKPGPNTEIIN
tara:strand:+ start:29 stop:244 length:216 start_codon:yes stop_codon:yes gene_type:complete